MVVQRSSFKIPTDAPQRKYDMDQSSRRVDLQARDLVDVRKILGTDGKLNDTEISRRSWFVCEIDDKSIFDEDVRRLARAFRSERADSFYVVRVCDLLISTSSVVAFRFDTTQD